MRKEWINERDCNSAPKTPAAWKLPYSGKVGMACLIFAESAIFTIFVGPISITWKSLSGPTPGEVLETPILYTICLLSSSLTIHFAGKTSGNAADGAAFLLFWLTHDCSGALFLYGTGQEWHRLIYEHGLTIFHEPFWNNVLLAGWPACLSRECWIGSC